LTAVSLSQTTFIVFARAPVPGRCKTRLIPQYGARGAARIHRRLTLITLRTICGARGAPYDVELWCEPGTKHAFFLRCRREFGIVLRRQPAGDLGRKMARAIQQSLAKGMKKVLIVGTDCPALTRDDLQSAANALDRSDVVLQPAVDGGYVLIGARRFAIRALHGIAWSSGGELMQTRRRLQRFDLASTELPSRWDVDHPVDVRRAKRSGLL
jgi:uncharacterized protein